MCFFVDGDGGADLPDLSPVVPAAETLSVDVKQVHLVFEIETVDQHVPILCMKTSLEAQLHDWTKQVRQCSVWSLS